MDLLLEGLKLKYNNNSFDNKKQILINYFEDESKKWIEKKLHNENKIKLFMENIKPKDIDMSNIIYNCIMKNIKEIDIRKVNVTHINYKNSKVITSHSKF